jgi:hypothetical protein
MASTFTKNKLSGSTNGKQILINSTSSANYIGIHTCVTGTTNFDEVWVWATNNWSSSVSMSIAYGATVGTGVNGKQDEIQVVVPPRDSPLLIIPGLVMNNGLIIQAYGQSWTDAATRETGSLCVNGFVNQIVT